MSSGSPGLTT